LVSTIPNAINAVSNAISTSFLYLNLGIF